MGIIEISISGLKNKTNAIMNKMIEGAILNDSFFSSL